MMRNLPFKFLVLGLVILSGCATSTFSVKTDPLQAEIFIENPKTGEKKSIGMTPLEIPMSNVKDVVGEEVMAGEFFTVVIEKKGFITQKLNIPATRFGTLLTQIDAPLKAGDEPKQIHVASEILDHLFIAQKLALAKEYDRAQVELDKILALAPDFTRAMTMRGSIYYIQKNYNESMKWYEEALKADPKMEEAVNMIARIKGVQGGANPATGVRTPATTPTTDSGKK